MHLHCQSIWRRLIDRKFFIPGKTWFLGMYKIWKVGFFSLSLGMFLWKSKLKLIPGNDSFLTIFFINYIPNMRIIISHFKIFGKVITFHLLNVSLKLNIFFVFIKLKRFRSHPYKIFSTFFILIKLKYVFFFNSDQGSNFWTCV